MLKRLSLLITLLFLLASLVEAFHYHDDGADHPQCSICVALHQSAESALTGVVYHVVRNFVETPYPRPVPLHIAKTFFTPVNSRAPPVQYSRA